MTTPYFYKIREISTGKIYVGCQYGQCAHPTNFWVTYFTSCKYVTSQPQSSFEVVSIITRPDAREYERRYLSKAYRLMGSSKFEQVFINRNLAPGVLFTSEVLKKMSDGVKAATQRRKDAGTYCPTFTGRSHTEETKSILSDMAKKRLSEQGHPRGMLGKHHTEETKQLISEKGVENSAMRGRCGGDHPTGNTVWWNNGISHIRSAKHPGDGWVQGRIFKTRSKRKIKPKE